MAFVRFTGGVMVKTRARSGSRGAREDFIESIERRCSEIASEMRCPRHHHNAKVLVDGENPEHLEVEVICCCNRFANRVREALRDVTSSAPLNRWG